MSVTNECWAASHARFTHVLLQFISTVISERYMEIFYGFVFHKVTKYIKAWVKSPKTHNRTQEQACTTLWYPCLYIADTNEIPWPEAWQLSGKCGYNWQAVAGICVILWQPSFLSIPADCSTLQRRATFYHQGFFSIFFYTIFEQFSSCF